MLTPDRILANKRYKIANSLINILEGYMWPGCILDIGCGKSMDFLNQIAFKNKYGIDPELDKTRWYWNGYGRTQCMKGKAFEHLSKCKDNFFDVITMLAVLEHIDIDKVEDTFKEIYRILKPNGRFILTTPSPKSKWIIKLLHWDKGHRKYYSIRDIVCKAYKVGLCPLYSGYFELGYNQWLYAYKEGKWEVKQDG